MSDLRVAVRFRAAWFNSWRRCSRPAARPAPFGLDVAAGQRGHRCHVGKPLLPWPSASQGHARASGRGLGLCCSARACCVLGGTISPRNSPRVRLGGPLGVVACCDVSRCFFAKRRTLHSGHLVLTGMLAQVSVAWRVAKWFRLRQPSACAVSSVRAPSRPQGFAYASWAFPGGVRGGVKNSDAPAWRFA